MRRRIRRIMIGILLFLGFALLLYPCVQMILSDMNQTIAVSKYEEGVVCYSEERKQEEFQKAEEYNKNLNIMTVSDPFARLKSEESWDAYNEILDVDMGMMGTLEIPCISVNLPIYHGISEEVLRKGVGHIKQTPFPIGGEGRHTILSAHRGLPESRLFSDLDKLEPGDEFYIHIFDEIFAYKVDQIKVVEPENGKYLVPIEGEDHVTLLTCTPYGINSHRLLVRGIRTEYVPEIKEGVQVKAVHKEWYMLTGIGVVLFLIFISVFVQRRKHKKEELR